MPDADDRHAVAAAIHSGAHLIATFNLKDFPPAQLERPCPVAQHPEDFIVDPQDLHASRVCEAATNHRRSLKSCGKKGGDLNERWFSSPARAAGSPMVGIVEPGIVELRLRRD